MGSDCSTYWIYDEHRKYADELARLRTRIADLEAACGVLGEECRAARVHYPHSQWPRDEVASARAATDAHPLAASFVKPKETTDGH